MDHRLFGLGGYPNRSLKHLLEVLYRVCIGVLYLHPNCVLLLPGDGWKDVRTPASFWGNEGD